jgi:hypothetical protein
MTRPPAQRLLTEANAATQAADPATLLGAVIAAAVSPRSGTTANRPVGAAAGFAYFDTTLGRPVWFKTGSTWVDAAGTTV